MKVIPITKKVADLFVKTKHYSHRPSIFWKGFGLLENENIEGVCVFGQPSPPIQKYAFKERDFRLYELCRLVIQTKTKNAASFLISHALNMLEKPCAVISYADTEQSHCGIVYQATNWIYTGETKAYDQYYLIGNERLHPITVRDRFGITDHKAWAKRENIQTTPAFKKHRYFFICADKKQKKQILEKLKYPVIKEYPKCNQKRYDDGEHLVIQP